MMKFPSTSGEGTAPAGNSEAATYPGVCGSRVGGGGRFDRAAGVAAGAGVWAESKFKCNTTHNSIGKLSSLEIFIA